MKKRFLIVFSCLAFLFSLFTFLFYLYLHTPCEPKTEEVSIAGGASLREIAEQLESAGVIRKAWPFILYAHLRGCTEELKAGDYAFKKKISPHHVLQKLIKGQVILYKIRIVDGWNLAQIAHYLTTKEFIQDMGFIAEFLEVAEDFEGYLLPETYHLSKEASPQDYLETFVRAFENFYLTASAQTPIASQWSKHEIVTLASVIEKETGASEERPLIASVFYNRLEKGMALQSDPTVIYGLKNFDGNLRKEDLTNPHPYNTYIHPGLPPGPICNPGKASILAALNPVQTDYLYFVSKNDGTHHFSKTATEHAEAVRQYQSSHKELKSP